MHSNRRQNSTGCNELSAHMHATKLLAANCLTQLGRRGRQCSCTTGSNTKLLGAHQRGHGWNHIMKPDAPQHDGQTSAAYHVIHSCISACTRHRAKFHCTHPTHIRAFDATTLMWYPLNSPPHHAEPPAKGLLGGFASHTDAHQSVAMIAVDALRHPRQRARGTVWLAVDRRFPAGCKVVGPGATALGPKFHGALEGWQAF